MCIRDRVSPYILEQFEKEVGYPFRPEYIIDQGYYNNQYRVPSKEFKDFQAFQRREVAKLAKEMVDITHECGKEAMMFLGDHWIGTEPFMEEFATIGLDAVVGSVGNGSTLRLISDIKLSLIHIWHLMISREQQTTQTVAVRVGQYLLTARIQNLLLIS